MKIKLFTHTDLDGIGCAILGKLAFKDKIDIDYCNYNDVNDKIKKFILEKQYKNYRYVYITDISVNEEVAELIDKTHPDNFKDGFNLGEMFQLLDHHPTALWLNKYFWAYVTEEDEELKEKTSGTRMFYNHLLSEEDLKQEDEIIKAFVEVVNRYDTWLWKEKYNDVEPKMWNDLLYIMGREEFINSIIYRLTHYDVFDFCDFDIKLLEYRQRDIDNYIEHKNKRIIIKDILGYRAGIIFAEQYHSELGNRLSELNPELDFIVIINMSQSISYRTTKDNIHLGNDIAKIFGGGGHAKAAGSPISDKIRENVIKMIFS